LGLGPPRRPPVAPGPAPGARGPGGGPPPAPPAAPPGPVPPRGGGGGGPPLPRDAAASAAAPSPPTTLLRPACCRSGLPVTRAGASPLPTRATAPPLSASAPPRSRHHRARSRRRPPLPPRPPPLPPPAGGDRWVRTAARAALAPAPPEGWGAASSPALAGRAATRVVASWLWRQSPAHQRRAVGHRAPRGVVGLPPRPQGGCGAGAGRSSGRRIAARFRNAPGPRFGRSTRCGGGGC